MIGWDHEKKRALVAHANCDSWSCPECAERMKERWILRARTGVNAMRREHQFIDFVTITSHEKLKTFEQTEYVWREAWATLYAALKRRNEALEFMIVPEKHRDGRMHVHALWNAGAPKRLLKNMTRSRGLGYMVDVSEVVDGHNAVSYVTKYIGKSLGRNVPAHFRRVRVSQGWWDIPAPKTEEMLLKWEYIRTETVLINIFEECQMKHIDLIDMKTKESYEENDDWCGYTDS